MATPYTVLELSPTATDREIRKAYKRLALHEHPDKGGSASKFRLIQSSFELLSDPGMKTSYDNCLGMAHRTWGRACAHENIPAAAPSKAIRQDPKPFRSSHPARYDAPAREMTPEEAAEAFKRAQRFAEEYQKAQAQAKAENVNVNRQKRKEERARAEEKRADKARRRAEEKPKAEKAAAEEEAAWTHFEKYKRTSNMRRRADDDIFVDKGNGCDGDAFCPW